MLKGQVLTVEIDFDSYVDVRVVALITRNAVATLNSWRSQGKGPPFRRAYPDKPGSKVEYLVSDVVAWMEQRIATQRADIRRMIDLAQERARAEAAA